MSNLRLGRIAYTNVVPVHAGIDAGAVPLAAEVVADSPARLNAAIGSGALDVSPVSAAYYLRNRAELVRLPGLCIGSRVEVMSVLLLSPTTPAKLDGRRVAVTADSASGRAMLEIIVRERYRADIACEPVEDALAAARSGKPTLVIGERALDAQASFPATCIYDLGAEWHAMTGGDMVYAVWVARAAIAREQPAAVAAIADALQASLAWSRDHVAETVALARSLADRPAPLYERYFRTLNYVLDAPAEAGLDRFARELAAFDAANVRRCTSWARPRTRVASRCTATRTSRT